MLPFCLQIEQVWCGSFSTGTSVRLPHLKTLARLIMSLFKVAKLALNHTHFSLVCLQYVLSGLLCLLQSSIWHVG